MHYQNVVGEESVRLVTSSYVFSITALVSYGSNLAPSPRLHASSGLVKVDPHGIHNDPRQAITVPLDFLFTFAGGVGANTFGVCVDGGDTY